MLVRLVALALASVLLVVAAPPLSAQPSSFEPVTVVDDSGFATTFHAPPRRIISLNPGHTETVFALGAGDRLVAVPGDLGQEKLGVDGFSERIDHFFHLAAIYDMQADDESMRKANVEGTRHVVEFANSIEVGTFHHTSSIAVAGKFKGLFREDMFDEEQKLPHAYHQTKFESERLVRSGVKAPLRVYRPGIVVGHSVTGEMDKVDGPYYFFKLIQRLRHALPEWFPIVGPEGKSANLVPVDFVARAMDHIAHMDAGELPCHTFHLVDPEPLTVGQTLNEFAKAAHAPRFAMRVDSNITNVVPPPVRAGLKAIPTIRNIRETVLRDLHIPPAALENRDFDADFDARETRRCRATRRSSGTTGSATSTPTSSASAASRSRSRGSGSS
jgi:thioester reductase-like protein